MLGVIIHGEKQGKIVLIEWADFLPSTGEPVFSVALASGGSMFVPRKDVLLLGNDQLLAKQRAN